MDDENTFLNSLDLDLTPWDKFVKNAKAFNALDWYKKNQLQQDPFGGIGTGYGTWGKGLYANSENGEPESSTTPNNKQTTSNDVKSTSPTVVKSSRKGSNTEYKNPVYGSSKIAALVRPALSALAAGLGYKNLKKIRDAKLNYDYRTPEVRGKVAPVMPIRSYWTPEQKAIFETALAKQKGAKYSDAATNVISDQMHLNKRLDALNEQSKIGADFLNKERERYSDAVADNAREAVEAANKHAELAASNYNKEGKEKADINADYESGRAKLTTEVINKVGEKLNSMGEYAYASKFKEQEIGKQNLLDKINHLQDYINDHPEDTNASTTLKALMDDLTGGRYGKHVGMKVPSYLDLDAGWSGVHAKAPNKRTVVTRKYGGKLIAKQRRTK
jgi:hypothetical protein